jgi:signal transduction histidine kinase/class 3 adenylate cyclase
VSTRDTSQILSSTERLTTFETTETYATWRDRFANQRLGVLWIVGLSCNPIFAGLDVVIYPQFIYDLGVIRVIMELGLFIGYLWLRKQVISTKPQLLLGFFIVWASLLVAYMTVLTGGFSSDYYNGLSLVFLGAAVIVPVYWRCHLFAQLSTLSYYYAGNLLNKTNSIDIHDIIQNSIFIFWTCTALIISVILYERLQRAEFEAQIAERRARSELESSHRKLLELDRKKNEFFANVSHELRTPLTLILGAFNTLIKTCDEEARELVHAGLRNASRLLLLINQLLDLARVDSGRAKLSKRSVNFTELIRNVAASFDSPNHRRVHYRGLNQAVAIYADPQQLRTVLFNLLSNAFKFSDSEEGQVWLTLAVVDGTVELQIEDNGIGIPREYQSSIFERFTQVESSATRKYEGSGIGLALVKEIITLHGGEITLESELGRGSTFTMTLPTGDLELGDIKNVHEEEDAVPTLIAAPAQDVELLDPMSNGNRNRDRPLVLVVDDNADMRGYLGRILQEHYSIILARDGREALQKAFDYHPELILTDAMMPHMSGYDLLAAVKKENSLQEIPVIFVTARAGTDAFVETLELGADDYIAKPVNEQEVLARVRTLIRGHRQEKELLALQKKQLVQFLPAQLGELILSGTANEFLKGHRRDITVVFVDLRGFTAFAAIADPEDVMSVLQEYQSNMGRTITRYNGIIEQFAGDSIMTILNDPIPVGNHPEEAVRMAFAMREEGAKLRERWVKQGFDLGNGIGIATGYATLGVIGVEGRKEYSAIGTVVNLADRLCRTARNGQILISERLLASVQDLVHTESLGSLELKGFQQRVQVYNVTGLKS